MSDQDDRFIVWFDVDNTLYSANTKISQAMGERIHAYFVTLGLSDEEASELHHKYYTTYGLALRGLTRHYGVDPLDFDRKCDGSLPLENMIKPHPGLRKLFQDIDRSKARVWALTNAYKPHAERVLRILNLEDQIDGLVYCNYNEPDFVCKPEPEYYRKALVQAQVTDPAKCLFVDDNGVNVHAARMLGWGRCVHFSERGVEVVEGGKTKFIQNGGEGKEGDDDVVMINDLEELRLVWRDIFKYSQPYTLAQAVLLDVAIITEEITRLQNSLKHLKRTQSTLQEYIASTSVPDPEFEKAKEENHVVIGSQEERIDILKMALRRKGVPIDSMHYDFTSNSGDRSSQNETEQRSVNGNHDNTSHSDPGGIYL